MHCDHLEEARQAAWILRAGSVSSDFQQEPPMNPSRRARGI